MTTTLIIRRESPGDADAVRRVHDAAFPPGDGTSTGESRLVDDLRPSASWIPALSIVAETPDEGVVGHVLATRGALVPTDGTTSIPALGVAPVGVVPAHQHLRIGSSLLYALIGAAQAMDEPLLCLLGNPAYYSRFGFVLAARHGVLPPVPGWAPHFQALVLDAARVRPGTFHYAAEFDELG